MAWIESIMRVSMKYKFKHLVLGGTFDLLHEGHKKLIDFALERGERVTVGLTSDKMAQIKNPSSRYKQRLEELENNLDVKNLSKVKIIKINDIYGSTATDTSIDGIVVTKDTVAGADKVNAKRKELGLEVLPIIVAPIIVADDNTKISSSRIRLGQMSRDGVIYGQFLRDKNLELPDSLRPVLARPFGPIIKNKQLLKKALGENPQIIVSVGDEVTRTLNKLATFVNLTIVDFKINRVEQTKSLKQLGVLQTHPVYKVENRAGTINARLSQAIGKFFDNPQRKTVIVVQGEEDLAVIPVILLAPLGTKIVYGQRGEGAVLVTVDQNLKKIVLELAAKFKTF